MPAIAAWRTPRRGEAAHKQAFVQGGKTSSPVKNSRGGRSAVSDEAVKFENRRPTVPNPDFLTLFIQRWCGLHLEGTFNSDRLRPVVWRNPEPAS